MTKILLVEDDKSLREIYGVRLLAEGYDIVSAGDGETALAMAIKERPQLIVSDVMMPKISGFDMLDILRSTTETKDIKVIMMTALSSEDQRARGEALGADRYLVKSQVGIEDVVRTVHDVLGDAPVSRPAQAQAFGAAPIQTAVRPAAPTTAPARPIPVSAAPQPPVAAPALPPPVATPAAQPVVAGPVPVPIASQPRLQSAPVGQPEPASVGLPQPTAPFSTARPANLGERVIHPLQPIETNQQDMAALISQELNGGATPALAPVAAAAPVAQPFGAQPTATAPVAPTPPTPSLPGIGFEETPRPTPPTVPSPFGAQPPQQ